MIQEGAILPYCNIGESLEFCPFLYEQCIGRMRTQQLHRAGPRSEALRLESLEKKIRSQYSIVSIRLDLTHQIPEESVSENPRTQSPRATASQRQSRCTYVFGENHVGHSSSCNGSG